MEVESREVEMPAAAVAMSLVDKRPDDSINERRSLTDDEHKNDDHQHEGEVLLLLMLIGRAHLSIRYT